MTPSEPTRDLGRLPIAWPTLALAIGVLAVWSGSTAAALVGVLPLWAAGLINTLAAFAGFTAMHDASHRSVARARWLNELVGRASGLPLMAPFPAFRYLHLEHHKHTNDPLRDPDHYSGRGPKLLLPLRWLTQDLHYYRLYFAAWSRRPVAERWETAISLAVLYGVAIALIVSGAWSAVLVLWLIPARVATALLALSFDYLPHRPHVITSREDRYRATHILADAWLTPLFLYQNYHLIHHLYPGVPFFRYARIFRAEEATLRAKGARVQYLLGGNKEQGSPDGLVVG
ncbi:MAG: fatty acid desaturase [Polyangiaceae bacterium]